MDMFFVLDNFLLSDLNIFIIDVVCGEDNGVVEVVVVVGGIVFYLYVLNGGDFSQVLFYSDLVVGIYELLVEDVQGCQGDMMFII